MTPPPSPDPFRRALIIIDVQNEFLSPNGIWPCPEKSTKPLIQNLEKMIPSFRASGAQVIWVKANYENPKAEPEAMAKHKKGTDKWLTEGTHVNEKPCCEAQTSGAEIHPALASHVDSQRDKIITKKWYSAFHPDDDDDDDDDFEGQGQGQGGKEHSKLSKILKEEKITHAFFCGVASGTCVLATLLDAVELVEEGKLLDLQPVVVTNCLGWRREYVEDGPTSHEWAMRRILSMTEEGKLSRVSCAEMMALSVLDEEE